MENPNHYHYVALMIFSSGTSLRAYYDYPVAMHRGREATYRALVTTFTGKTSPNTSESRFTDHLRFKTVGQHHDPMQVCLYEHPFHSSGITLLVNSQFRLMETSGSRR